MKTILEESINALIIKNSEFIGYLKNVENVDEAKEYIEQINQKHSSASHNCFAYIIGQDEKASDDGEPGGTAGVPILNVLKNNELSNIICIVTRYFGGVKLGSGGLVRAYSKACAEVIKKSTLVELIDGYLIEIIFDYPYSKYIDYLLRDYKLLDKDFGLKVKYSFNIKQSDFENIKEGISNINHLIEINIKKEVKLIDF